MLKNEKNEFLKFEFYQMQIEASEITRTRGDSIIGPET